MKGTIWITISRATGIIFGTLAVLILTRKLGPAGYGYLPLIASLVEVGLIFGDGGLGSGTAYFIAQNRGDLRKTEALIHHSLRLRLWSLLPILLIFASVLWLVIPLLGVDSLRNRWFFIAVLFLFLIQILSRWVSKVFEGLGETRYSGMIQAALSWASPAGQAGCAFWGLGVIGVVYAQVVGNGIVLVSLFIMLIAKFLQGGISTTPVTTGMLVNYSMPLMVMQGTAFVYSSGGTLLVKWFGSIQDVSYYCLAAQIVIISQIPALAFGSSTAPLVAAQRDVNNAKKVVQNGIRFITFAYMPLAIYTAIAAPWLIRFLFTEAYAPASEVLIILQPYLVAYSYAGLFSLLLDYTGKARQRASLVGPAALLFLGSGIVAGARYGMIGVAWATVGTYLPLVACYGYFVSCEFKIPIAFYTKLWSSTLLALLPGLAIIILASTSTSFIVLFSALLIGYILYVIISFRLGLISEKDIMVLKSIIFANHPKH